MRTRPLSVISFATLLIAPTLACLATLKYLKPTGPAMDRSPAIVSFEINRKAPRMVTDRIRLDGASTKSAVKITFIYVVTSLRSAEIKPETWREEVRPMLEQNIRRAESEEAKGLLASGVTVTFRYLDRDGLIFAEIVDTIDAHPDEPRSNLERPIQHRTLNFQLTEPEAALERALDPSRRFRMPDVAVGVNARCVP